MAAKRRVPFHVEFVTAHGPISGWVWATSTKGVSRAIDDELGGAAFSLRTVKLADASSAPRPKDFDHSRGSRHFVRDLGPSMPPGTKRG